MEVVWDPDGLDDQGLEEATQGCSSGHRRPIGAEATQVHEQLTVREALGIPVGPWSASQVLPIPPAPTIAEITTVAAAPYPMVSRRASSSRRPTNGAGAAGSCRGRATFYSTDQTVADLDMLRQALGAEKMTVDGVSYGS